VNWHGGLSGQPDQPARRGRQEDDDSIYPLVSVCLAYNVRGHGAAATLASLKQQDYPHFEVIVAECGSDHPAPSPSENDVRAIPVRSLEIGAGRNAAAREAKGDYLLFVDDHTLLLPSTALSTFVQVAQRVGADIVTSAISFFIGSSNGGSNVRMEHSRRPFLGGDIATGAFVNCYGSPNALVRRDAFEAVGGFSHEAITSLDDWEFFSKAALQGLHIETMPEVYTWIREDPEQESMVHSLVNAVRSIQPYTAPGQNIAPSAEPALARVMRFGQGLKLERDVAVGSPLSRGEQGPAVTG
jgi:glycosyltransferase involved in cell wall biosynthesis